ncbi:MAG: hypothetical protein MUP09_06995 [Thiovulaceae bacterium]|nr:hypothetical protein [Sulfurimonadaceae bacterium]
MKVIIDLIEDIRTAISNDKSFSLAAMGLKEEENGDFSPSWESGISGMKVDDAQNRLFLFLGKGEALTIESFLGEVNDLPISNMMYEVCISYSKEQARVDSSLMGFGESFRDKKYLLFIPE